MSSRALNVNVKCGKEVSIQTVKPPIGILNLDLGCSGHHGSLLLPPYYLKETNYNITNSFQSFFNGLQTNTLWDQFNQRFPQTTKYDIPPKLKNIKQFPMDTLLAELPEVRLISMKIPSWIESPWFYITIVSTSLVIMALIFKLMKNREKVKKKLSKLGCLRCNKSEGKGKEENVPTKIEDQYTIEEIPLETFHREKQTTSQPSGKKNMSKRIPLEKSCRPDHALSQRYLKERKGTSATTSIH
jgi:hypothetical protein